MVESTPLTRERSEPLSLADLGKKIKSNPRRLLVALPVLFPELSALARISTRQKSWLVMAASSSGLS